MMKTAEMTRWRAARTRPDLPWQVLKRDTPLVNKYGPRFFDSQEEATAEANRLNGGLGDVDIEKEED